MSAKAKFDRLEGSVRALGITLLAIIDRMPPEQKAATWQHVDAALDGAKTALLNSEARDAEIEGFDEQADVFREVR